MNKFNVRSITDGAIIVSIYAIFLLISRFIGGLLEDYLYFLLPIPVAIYGYKYSFKHAISCVISIIALSFIFISPYSALFFVLPGVCGGAVLSSVLKKEKSFFFEVMIGFSISLVTSLLTMVIFGYLFNYDIVNDTILLGEELIKTLLNLGLKFDGEVVLNILLSLIPSLLIVVSIVEGLCVILLTKILLRRLKLSSAKIASNVISVENVPSFLGIIYFVLLIFSTVFLFLLINKQFEINVFIGIIFNLTIIYSFVVIYQGLFVVLKYSKLYNKIWLYFLAVISIFVCPFIMLFIGLFQNIFHISRKI